MTYRTLFYTIALLFLLAHPALAATYFVDPGDDLNDAFEYAYNNGYDVVHLNSGIHWIDETLRIPEDTIIDGNGEIKLVDDAGWDHDGTYTNPMIMPMAGHTGPFTIMGITIDGNSQGNTGVPFGKGYYNMLEFKNCYDITLDGVTLEYGKSDGLKVRNSDGINMVNCTVNKVGHDAGYFIQCTNVKFINNDVFTRTNSACRISGGAHILIKNNEVYSGPITSADGGGSSTGSGFEIDLDGSQYAYDVEICNNYIHDLRGSGIWLTSANNLGRDVYIHNNLIRDVGNYPIDNKYSTAGITIFQFDNTTIENNVFDDTGIAGVRHAKSVDYATSGMYETIVRNNVFVNIRDKITITAVPILNTYNHNHRFYVYNNNFYNNYDTFDGEVYKAQNNYALNPMFADVYYHLKADSPIRGLGWNGYDLGAYGIGDEIVGAFPTGYAGSYDGTNGPGSYVDNDTVEHIDDPCNEDIDNSTAEYEDPGNDIVDNSTADYEDPEIIDDPGNDLIDNSTADYEDPGNDLIDNSTMEYNDPDELKPSKKKSSSDGYGHAIILDVKKEVVVGLAQNTKPTYNG